MSADKSTEWDLPMCRRRFGELQRAYAEVFSELQQAGSNLVSATYQLDLARKRLAVLQRELEASQRREKLLLAELHAAKRGGTVTPIRPPRGGR